MRARSGQADGWTGADEVVGRSGGRGPRGADRWTGGRGADGAQQARTGGLGGRGQKSHDRADWADWADGHTGSPAVGRTGGQASGPGFKRPHSTRPISLLGAPSACLVRARVRRVPGSAVGSSRILRQIPVLSARTHLPRLSASLLGAEKGILLLAIRK